MCWGHGYFQVFKGLRGANSDEHLLVSKTPLVFGSDSTFLVFPLVGKGKMFGVPP